MHAPECGPQALNNTSPRVDDHACVQKPPEQRRKHTPHVLHMCTAHMRVYKPHTRTPQTPATPPTSADTPAHNDQGLCQIPGSTPAPTNAGDCGSSAFPGSTSTREPSIGGTAARAVAGVRTGRYLRHRPRVTLCYACMHAGLFELRRVPSRHVGAERVRAAIGPSAHRTHVFMCIHEQISKTIIKIRCVRLKDKYMQVGWSLFGRCSYDVPDSEARA